MKRQAGFSLLELLCVLAILSVLAYAGSTQFLTVSQNAQDQSTLKNEIKQLSDGLLQARQLAVVSGTPSFVCGGLDCDGLSSDGLFSNKGWSSGFVLYQKGSNDEESKVYRRIIFDERLLVAWQGFPVSKQYIEFQTNGLSGYQNGTFEFCLGVWQAGLVLNQSGRFYMTDPQEKSEGDCL